VPLQTTSPLWSRTLSSNLGDCQTMIWRWYVLVQMVHPPFKASKLRFHPIEKIQFFCIPIHYVVHMINLVVLTLFYLHIVVKIEVLFKASTHIWVTTLSKTLKDGNWLRLWKQKISKYCGILGANGLVWFF
jgi:hypothetical protein